ncbi:MAG: anthranilate phosphoribosyltransferase [Myxococcota bacterium]|jgi:anthranilate phosphoribosyltransferase
MMDLRLFSQSDYSQTFSKLYEGKLQDEEAKEFLIQLNQIGFSSSSFMAAMQIFRPLCKAVNAPIDAIDVCGTGGDKLNTLNISTAVALLVSSCGVPVAKHGNKAISSKSGSADVLFELGIDIMADQETIEKSLYQNNLCFMFAPLYHEAFKAVANIRAKIAIPTIFNFLGPLLNPANTKLQLIGTSNEKTMRPMIEALKARGSKKVFIVHGLDGMDEISISTDSLIIKLEDGNISEVQTINPMDYGMKKSPIESIKGGDAKHNAQKIIELFDGADSAYQDIVVLNSAFAFLVASKVKNVEEGIKIAKDAIKSGKVKNHLKKLTKNKYE